MKFSLLFVSQYFYPEEGATSQVLSALARGLASRGYNVQALTAQPSYHGKKRIPRHLSMGAVKIRRIWSTRFSKDGILGRVLNSVSFAFSAFLALLATPRDTLVLAVTNPPLLPWSCLGARLLRGHRYVVILHDLYPDVAVRLGVLRKNSPLVRLWRFLNEATFSRAEAVVVLGRDAKNYLRKNYQMAHRPLVSVIPTGADGKLIRSHRKKENRLLRSSHPGRALVVQYSGNMGRIHDLDTLLDASQSLSGEPFLFVFVGEGFQKAHIQERVRGQTNVRFLPYQPHRLLGDSLTSCDVGLVTLKTGLSGLSVPSKLYGILAAGRPALVIADKNSEAARTVREHGCGFVVPPGKPKALVRALRELKKSPQLRRRMGRAGRKAFEANYDLPKINQAWTDLLEKISRRTHRARTSV